MTRHKPVLLQSAVADLHVKSGGIYVDATLGGGGHSREILKQMDGYGSLVALDFDSKAVEAFGNLLINEGFTIGKNSYTKDKVKVYLQNRNFKELETVLSELKIDSVDGVLADLGISSDQLDDPKRGFTHRGDANLDMRLSDKSQVKARDLLNVLYKKELEAIFQKYSEIEFANRLANEIIKFRKIRPIKTSRDLKHIIQKIVPSDSRKGASRQPEARVFQALRIAVNDELNSLSSFLPQAFEALSLGNNISVISFHSGEDRIVKSFFKQQITNNRADWKTKLLRPDKDEIKLNPRSESAILRSITKK